MKRFIPLLVAVLLLLLILAWAPWMNDSVIRDKVLLERGNADGIVTARCDYSVSFRIPFGMYVASCEAGYFVTFYGKIIP
ncbi:MAG: hypothetical protein HY917_02325 [Candidatus Diapherotrites archaeon]|nr:hypothetical protein [Candidatus Diapherotrites archaeon]